MTQIPRTSKLALVLSLVAATSASAQSDSGTSPAALRAILDGGIPKSIADLRAMETHHQQLLEKVLPAMVTCNGASGVIIKDGFVLTCAHVTRRANRDVPIILQSGKRLKGRALGLNHRTDAGLVKIQGTPEEIAKLPYAETGKIADLKVGQWVAMLGQTGGRKSWRMPPLRVGRMIRIPSSSFIVSDCTMAGGDSGGPLFDMDGRVVGINSRISRSLQTNMHVPIDAFYKDWEKFLKGETIGQSRTSRSRGSGRTATYPGSAIGWQGDPTIDGEAVVAELEEGCAAEKAGVKVGDIVLGYRTRTGRLRKFRSARALLRNIYGYAPGNKVKYALKRGEKELEVQIELPRREQRRQNR